MRLRRLLHIGGDQRDSRVNSPQPPSSDRSAIQITQPIEPFIPQDLWQIAYDQLEEEKRKILSKIEVTGNSIGKENQFQTEILIGEVIRLTKERYEEFRQNANGKIRTSSRKIINAALSFNDIIRAVAAFDPTQHAASAWTIVSLGLTVSNTHQQIIKVPDLLSD